MTLLQIVILAIIQGLAELLPVSSSAHVIAGAKLMHLDPSSPQFTLLLVMLHTGTMFAVILYFWKAWKRAFFSTREKAIQTLRVVIVATLVTGIIGLGLQKGIEKVLTKPGQSKAEIEELFSNLPLIAVALAAAGLVILLSGLQSQKKTGREEITDGDAVSIGAIQGLCLPFRGFSRSGATISLGLLRGVAKQRMEEYSFALAVALTPAVIAKEALRLMKHKADLSMHDFTPSLIGMVFSFIGGLIALKILSGLLEHGKWWIFAVYCFIAAGGIYAMHLNGY